MFFSFFFLFIYLRRNKTTDLVLFTLFYVLQNISFGYITVGMNICLFGILVFNLGHIIIHKNMLIRLFSALIISVIVSIPFYLPYLKYALKGFIRHYSGFEYFGSDLISYFIPLSILYLKYFHKFIMNNPKIMLSLYFPGIIVTIISLYSFYNWIKTYKQPFRFIKITLWILLALFFFFVTLGPQVQFSGKKLFLNLPYYLLFRYTPLFRGTHCLPVYYYFSYFAVCVSIAYAFSSIKIKKYMLIMISTILIILIGIENYLGVRVHITPAYIKNSTLEIKNGKYVPKAYQFIAKQKGDFSILELPITYIKKTDDDKVLYQQYEYQYYSLFHRKKIISGIDGFWPSKLFYTFDLIEKLPSEKSINYLRYINNKYILVHDENNKKARVIVEGLKKSKSLRFINSFGKIYIFEVLPLSATEKMKYKIYPRLELIDPKRMEVLIKIISNSDFMYSSELIKSGKRIQLIQGDKKIESFPIDNLEPVFDPENNRISCFIDLDRKLLDRKTVLRLIDSDNNILSETNFFLNTRRISDSRKPDELKYEFIDLQYPGTVEKGSQLMIKAIVKNKGNTVWLSKNNNIRKIGNRWIGVVRLGIEKWIDKENKAVRGENRVKFSARADFKINQYPDDIIEIKLRALVPEKPGEYIVILDMLVEDITWIYTRNVTWFYKRNETEPKRIKIKVVDKM